VTKGKRTIQRDSVIRRSGGEGEHRPPAQGIQTEDNPNRQTAVWLSDAEVDWLDDKLTEIKRGGWRGASRSALIRAIIQSARQSDESNQIQLEGVSGEPEITQRFIAR
jgi:hypothetical protein